MSCSSRWIKIANYILALSKHTYVDMFSQILRLFFDQPTNFHEILKTTTRTSLYTLYNTRIRPIYNHDGDAAIFDRVREFS